MYSELHEILAFLHLISTARIVPKSFRRLCTEVEFEIRRMPAIWSFGRVHGCLIVLVRLIAFASILLFFVSSSKDAYVFCEPERRACRISEQLQ